ncbi:hypothetical protein BMS3Abin02_02486 [bacterium BMS3Abin02]|nr:hypothetical protein BMS3Abin02_02486 [bacterium BMS3Abin02]GBE22577.1 hypothetical protein BMS3Bbin01_01952 [bacterium BMS3Bbin01]HDK46019.1 hypothetical protein [Actinomycetota bacterium]HDL50275.1 hypothetical protein [Actinomycetota bacterium]
METFVVRIFHTPETGVDPDLRGQVEHVRSGTRRIFRSLDELATFLESADHDLIDLDNLG